MRVIRADIGHSGELHRMLVEYARDMHKPVPTPDFWFAKFSDPTFYCLLAKHGRKPVGFIMGNLCMYFDEPVANIDAVFVRRGFRKFKFVKELISEGKDFLKALKIFNIAYNREKSKVRSLWLINTKKV